MRSSTMTAIAEGPAAPLSPRTRADLRADRTPPPAPFVRSESGRRLARALDRFARGERDREAWLIYGPPGSGRTTVVLRAVEQAMVALTWLDRPVQLLPVPIRTSALWGGSGDRFDEVRMVARFLAVAALTELVERLGARAGDDPERSGAVESMWQTLRGVPERDELRALRSKAEPRFSLFGDDDEEGGEHESVRREADVLWQAVRLRGVRPPKGPAPIIEQIVAPSVDPAVVEALRAEVARLSAALAARDEVVAEQLRIASRSNDPTAVVLGAIAGGAFGLALGNVTLSVTGGLLGGALGFFLGSRNRGDGQLELEPLPPMADPPAPAPAPAAPAPAVDEHADEAVDDGPPDVDALVDLLRHFIHDLRTVGYAPVFVLDELDRAHRDRDAVEARITRLLADLPDGACAILVAERGDFAEGAPEINERLPVDYTPAALHAYLDRRLTLPGDLSETAEADARIDKAILRYALLHAARMRPGALDRMLADRRMGAVRLDAQAPRSVYALRIRAAQQMALEVVLAERAGNRGGDHRFTALLAAALQLPLIRWEEAADPDVTVDELRAHLERRMPGRWDAAEAEQRDRIWAAMSLLLGLMSSRAGLVARLPAHLAPLADLIPDAPLVVRHGDSWRWAFDPEGHPTRAGLGDEPEPEPAPKASADEMGARFRAIAGEGLEAPRRLSPGDPLPLTGEYRAWGSAAREDALDGSTDGSLDGALDGSVDEPRAAYAGSRRPLIDPADAARFLEAVDEALAGVGDGTLSIGRLARVGLLPTIPTPAAVARALAEGDTPGARLVLDEAVGRIRERLGIIEKFALWLTAARTLVPDENIGTLQIAATLVRARALRGRPASAQHAHLVNRVLQSELRSLCPRLRLKTTIFRRQANPGVDPDALARWGEVVRKKAEDLAEAVSIGTTRKNLDGVAWRALRTRLRLLVTDGEAGLPTFAEAIAALVGVAGATVTDWLSPEPTARNLSALLLAAREHSEPDRLGDGGLYAALALGLNRNGTDAVGLELPKKETSEAGDLIRETSRARAPVALVLTTDPRKGLAASRPPRRGSALVLTPDEVITSTKKLGFEVIFLDDPSIDAGLLPLPPAPVLAPPLTDDIDAALGWWTTHR